MFLVTASFIQNNNKSLFLSKFSINNTSGILEEIKTIAGFLNKNFRTHNKTSVFICKHKRVKSNSDEIRVFSAKTHSINGTARNTFRTASSKTDKSIFVRFYSGTGVFVANDFDLLFVFFVLHAYIFSPL